MSGADFRVGHGLDAHRLVAGRGLMLGGVFISCDLAVEADSDGDLLLHALADAMLGAAGLGDIGELFAPGSAAGRGLSGEALIAAVRRRIEDGGWRTVQADLTLVGEAPRLAPHRQSMRQNVAAMLGVEVEDLSVKATTTDGLGFIGRGEGLAALATVVLRRAEGGK